jgi:type IV pilus assembly protein PilV
MVVSKVEPLAVLLSPTCSRCTSAGQAPPRRAGRTQRGFALLEALISILIFTFGILGLIGLEASAVNSAVDSDDRNRAALFASEIASTMWLNGSVTVSATQYNTWQTAVGDPTKTGVSNGVLTIVAPVAGTTNAADITITWKAPSRAATAASSQLTTRVILP